MTTRTERRFARGNRAESIIAGYLQGSLAAAAVASNELTPGKVDGYIFEEQAGASPGDPDQWVHVGDVEDLTNFEENVTGERGYYFEARWTGRSWRLIFVGCEATALTLPGDA